MATDPTGRTPRAVIHKRILDEASNQPDAPLEAIAGAIPGATTDLVERVLDEYGDPVETGNADSEPEAEQPSEASDAKPDVSEPSSDAPTPPEPADLTTKQRETLQQINQKPTATQREIGEALNVSGATISNRLREIAGFDWQDRQDFVSNFFGTSLISDGQGPVDPEAGAEGNPRLADLESRVSAIETDASQSGLPPELAHKVLHTCMDSDAFSEAEELELIRALVGE